MNSVLEGFQKLFDKAKSAPAKDRACFSLSDPSAPTFTKNQHYLQILVNEMYLAKARQWWVEYDPVVLVVPSYIYGTQTSAVPMVVGPMLFKQYSSDIGDGSIIRNAPVTGLHPYRGGSLTLTVIFNKVQRVNNSDRMLQALESITSVASPIAPTIPFATYLKMAGSVMGGLEILFDLPETKPVIAYRETTNPQIDQTLKPSYLVLIDAPGITKEEQSKFKVVDSQLHYQDESKGLIPYRQNDFIVLQIAQGSHRTDESVLPFYPIWLETQRLGLQSRNVDALWQEAKTHFNTLKVAMYESPDLIKSDVKFYYDQYFQELKDIRQGAAADAQLKAGEFALGDDYQDMQSKAKSLDELDEL
ncbi:MAG: hypothetical protein H6Q38_923 [Chloroflexi bacterium]|nr:hypothetical protein [Chloroflexota bacterium]